MATHKSQIEAELVAGCQRREARSQRALYERFKRLMFGVCLRYTDDREDARDVMQEGFIKVFEKIGGFRGEGSLEGWIRRIMVHCAIEHYRRNSRFFYVDIADAPEIGLDVDALAQLSHEALLDQIRQLPAGYRTIFNLYVIEGYSHPEIGAMLGISEGTSKSQLSRAKALLRDGLRQKEIPNGA